MNYPNLELLEYKTKEVIKDKFGDKYKNVELHCHMFPQGWASTALGFGGIGGQMMTTAYTTVFEDVSYGLYIVFFGDRMAYIVENPNDIFWEDFRNRDLKSVKEALAHY